MVIEQSKSLFNPDLCKWEIHVYINILSVLRSNNGKLLRTGSVERFYSAIEQL